MSFIRITDLATGKKIDLNSNNIMAFSEADVGTKVIMSSGPMYIVSDSARSLRGYIKKANGQLPSKAVEATEE